MYILEVRNRETQRLVYRRISRWSWLHTWHAKRLQIGTLNYIKSYTVN